MAYTKGQWEAYLTNKTPPEWTICAGVNGEQGIAKTVVDDSISILSRKANANLIAAAVNACAEVNPENPQAVAESIGDMYEALKSARAMLPTSLPIESIGYKTRLQIDKTLAKADGK